MRDREAGRFGKGSGIKAEARRGRLGQGGLGHVGSLEEFAPIGSRPHE